MNSYYITCFLSLEDKGLSDVIDGYDGYVIEVNSESFRDAQRSARLIFADLLLNAGFSVTLSTATEEVSAILPNGRECIFYGFDQA